jgi:hypothetical protein
MIRRAVDHLWLMKIWWVQWKRRFKRTDDLPFRHFLCILHKFHGHFFTKLCLIKLLGLHRRRHYSTMQDTKTRALLRQVPQQWWKLCQKVGYGMYIKWQYKWFGYKFLFFFQ